MNTVEDLDWKENASVFAEPLLFLVLLLQAEKHYCLAPSPLHAFPGCREEKDCGMLPLEACVCQGPNMLWLVTAKFENSLSLYLT